MKRYYAPTPRCPRRLLSERSRLRMALGDQSVACSLALSLHCYCDTAWAVFKHAPRHSWSRSPKWAATVHASVAVLMYSYASHLRLASRSCASVGGLASLLDPGRGATKWRSLCSITHHGGCCRCRCVGGARGGLGVQEVALSSEAAGCSSGIAGGLLVRFTAPLMPQPPSRALKPPVPAMRGHCCP